MPEVDWSSLVNTAQHCEALELLDQLPDDSIDLIFTDPPYGKKYKANWQTTNSRHAKRKTSGSFGKDVAQFDWLAGAYRVLKPDCAMYLCTQWDVLHLWREPLKTAGFKVDACLVWDKLNWGGGNLETYGCQTEFILLCTKGKHVIFPEGKGREGNVWTRTKLDTINNEGNYDNPTQKPEWLVRRACQRSSRPGDVVLDLFCGSGTTGAAARVMKRRYILCDRDQKQFNIASKRLALPYQVHFMEVEHGQSDT